MVNPRKTLTGIPLFRSVTGEDLRRIEATCSWIEIAAGQWVIDYEGDGTEFYITARGHLRVITRAGAGRETILADMTDGDFFGEVAALDGQPRSAGILSVSTSVVISMPAETLRKAITDHPDVCHQILAVLVGQVRRLTNRANEAAGLTGRERLWAELLRLAQPARGESGSVVISPPPTHAELAARVASHREAVTRELNLMERSGLIARRRGAIEVLDPARLRRMVDTANEMDGV